MGFCVPINKMMTNSFEFVLDPKKYYLVNIIGSVGSGKSTLTKNLIYYLSDKNRENSVKFGVVFTRTSYESEYDFIPKKYVYDDDFFGVMTSYITKLEKFQTKKKLEPNFLILDDAMNIIKSSDEQKLFEVIQTRHRHLKMHIIIVSHFATSRSLLPPITRSLCDIAFAFDSHDFNNLDSLWRAFGRMNKEITLDVFTQILRKATKEKYHCLCIPFTLSPDLNYNFFSFKSENPPKFLLKY